MCESGEKKCVCVREREREKSVCKCEREGECVRVWVGVHARWK